jgi:hypothetical protein
MAELTIKTDILAPAYVKTLKFSGHNPARLLKEMPGLLLETFKRTPPDLFWDQIKWDVLTEPVAFYGAWRIRDRKDLRSTVWGIVIIQGKQAKDMSGSATVWLRGDLITKFPYTSFIEKAIARVYIWLFYKEHKRRYVAEARERLDALEDAIRKLFGIMARE